jgi:hypothetical protein
MYVEIVGTYLQCIETRLMLYLCSLLRHHLCHLPWYFFLWNVFIFFCHHELFGLHATLEFWCIEFETGFPPIGLSLYKGLMLVHSALRKRVSVFILHNCVILFQFVR